MRDRIIDAGDRPHVSVARQLSLLEQLTAFELGRFLLTHQGLNGFWTHYIVYLHTEDRRAGTQDDARLSELERALLDRGPTFRATQERFEHFRRIVQDEIRHKAGAEMSLASVPCGLMADLLTLDYRLIPGVQLAGFDLDERSLQGAAEFAQERGLPAAFSRADAWTLGVRNSFDAVVSNGLNIYEPSDERVTDLYAILGASLKPGGVLVTSFLTPPSEWKMDRIDGAALLVERIIFSDIVGARWRCFRSWETSVRQLTQAGFTNIKIIPDDANLFPTVVARRPV